MIFLAKKNYSNIGVLVDVTVALSVAYANVIYLNAICDDRLPPRAVREIRDSLTKTLASKSRRAIDFFNEIDSLYKSGIRDGDAIAKELQKKFKTKADNDSIESLWKKITGGAK